MGNINPIRTMYVERVGNQHVRAACSSSQGYRSEQEDAHALALSLHPAVPMLFGVFDGHGGNQASIYLKDHLADSIKELADPWDEKQIENAVLDLDDAFLKTADANHGSTACFALVRPSEDTPGGLTVKVANVGDSRALLVKRDGSYEALSKDHKPSDPPEMQRIKNAQGWVDANRVNGNLAVSRAIGDSMYKTQPALTRTQQKVIAQPDFMTAELRPDDVLLMCCDGVYEQMSWGDVASVVHTEVYGPEGKDDASTKDLGLVMNKLIEVSMERGSKDNHTGIIIHVGDGTNFATAFPAKQVFPGPFHQHANDSQFVESYKRDLEANGYKFDDVLPQIKEYEAANDLPTSVIVSGLRRNIAADDDELANARFLRNLIGGGYALGGQGNK